MKPLAMVHYHEQESGHSYLSCLRLTCIEQERKHKAPHNLTMPDQPWELLLALKKLMLYLTCKLAFTVIGVLKI